MKFQQIGGFVKNSTNTVKQINYNVRQVSKVGENIHAD